MSQVIKNNLTTGKHQTQAEKSFIRSIPYYLMLLPTLIIVFLFSYYPPLSGLWYSFRDWQMGEHSTFVGLANYLRMFQDENLIKAWFNVAYLTLANILFKGLLGPLILAELLFFLKSKKWAGFYRNVLVFLMVMPTVAALLIWRNWFLWDGLLNNILRSIGLPNLVHTWVAEPGTSLFALFLAGFPWVSTIAVLTITSGLMTIPGEIIESARLDGASWWRQIINLHLPLIRGPIKLTLVMTALFGLQDFMGPMLLTRGGPFSTSTLPGLEMFNQLVVYMNSGYACAIGITIAFVIMLLTILINKLLPTDV
jgi:ABC-type sugar transport system permease subunit